MRSVVAVAMSSGIAVDVWLEGDPRALFTAMALLAESSKGG